MSVKYRWILICAVVVVGLIWLRWPDDRSVKVPEEITSSIPEQGMSEVTAFRAIEPPPELLEVKPPAMGKEVKPPSMEKEVAELIAEPEAPELSIEEATSPIFALLPDWLRESGEVRRERVQVAGHWVSRVRSRYAWDGGEQVEVEVTDLGEAATEDLLKSLGFDLELESEETDTSFRAVHDEGDYVSNLEYDEEDASGRVQYIVAGRYLMEIQIEGLSFEAFQDMEDRDGLIGGLLDTASRPNGD